MAKSKPNANDLQREGTYLFATLTTVSKAFRTVADLNITAKQMGDGIGNTTYKDGTEYVRFSDLQPYIRCRNPQCYGGGFPVEQTLRFMVEDRASRKEIESMSCVGHEGTKTRRDAPCGNYLKNVVIEVAYKPAQ